MKKKATSKEELHGWCMCKEHQKKPKEVHYVESESMNAKVCNFCGNIVEVG